MRRATRRAGSGSSCGRTGASPAPRIASSASSCCSAAAGSAGLAPSPPSAWAMRSGGGAPMGGRVAGAGGRRQVGGGAQQRGGDEHRARPQPVDARDVLLEGDGGELGVAGGRAQEEVVVEGAGTERLVARGHERAGERGDEEPGGLKKKHKI